ncbi:MAG: hypothetical protein HY840_06060 [Bacteroidetes bacterium]|nr:hypothetical protein [Bacteroidota bacterium]
MKKKKTTDDLEIFVDPKPLTKIEELALSRFIKELKSKAKSRKKKRTNYNIDPFPSMVAEPKAKYNRK